MTQYQVVAECAHATIQSPFGKSVQLLLKGAMVPADAPQLKHLLEIGSVAKVDEDETGGVDAGGIPAAAYDADVPAGVTTTPVPKSDEQVQAEADAAEQSKVDAEVAERRAAAKAKLPADGSAPDGRAADAVFVEYLVANGYGRDEVEKADRAELRNLASSVKK